MSKKCSICCRPDVAEIDRALVSGRFQKDVAGQFRASVSSLSRHVKHSREPQAESLTEKAALWASRAETLWASAVYDQDLRSQVAAISTGLKALQAATQQAERDAARQVELKPTKIDPSFIDDLIAHADQRQLELCLEESQRLHCPDLYAAFCEMVGKPDLQARCIEFVSEWLEAKAELHDRT